MKKSWFTFGGVLFLLFGAVLLFNGVLWFIKKQMLSHLPEPVVPVTVTTVTPTTWNHSIPITGTIQAAHSVVLKLVPTGIVSEISAYSGQTVQKGDLILSLDHQIETAQLEREQATLPVKKAAVSRHVWLLKKGATTPEALEAARAELKALEASIRGLQASIDQKRLYAPFSGTLGRIQVQVGEYVPGGTDLVRLEDQSSFTIESQIPQTQISALRVGQPISLEWNDAQGVARLTGKVSVIEPAIEEFSGMLLFEAQLDPTPDSLLKSGMFIQGQLSLPPLENQIVLPQEAINFQLYGEMIYRVRAHVDGSLRAEPVKVETLQKTGSLALIKSGVEPGDQIVVTGQMQLRPNSKVAIHNETSQHTDTLKGKEHAVD